jgi:hypothetical protein
MLISNHKTGLPTGQLIGDYLGRDGLWADETSIRSQHYGDVAKATGTP